MTMKMRLIKEYDDHEPVILGTVATRTAPDTAAGAANAWVREDLSDLFQDDGSLSDQALLELHEMDRLGFFI